MTPRPPVDASRMGRRKQDLLLASGLAREQAVAALGEIGGTADRLTGVAIRIHAWASLPGVWLLGSVGASALTLWGLPRLRALRLLRWGALGLRLWTLADRLRAARRGVR